MRMNPTPSGEGVAQVRVAPFRRLDADAHFVALPPLRGDRVSPSMLSEQEKPVGIGNHCRNTNAS
jgi:hypothetical protein